MEGMEKKSGLSVLLNFTNILGLAVIIALALVIKILLDQKESVKDKNKELTAQTKELYIQIEEKNADMESLISSKTALETKLADLEKNQGCDSYIEELADAEKALKKAKNENYKILKTFQDQSDQLKHLSEKTKILEGFIDDGSELPN